MSAKRARFLHGDLNRDLVAADGKAGIYLENGRLVRRRWRDGKKLTSQTLGQNDFTLETHIDTAMGALVHFENVRNGYRLRRLALRGLSEAYRREFQAEGEPLGITSHLGTNTVSIWFRDSQGILLLD
ncbi:MAG: hypothetical protein KF799_13305 [Bdellovibrionales bacterium]|nr:hypothetical protein [Bdellovibrionales bacterium]